MCGIVGYIGTKRQAYPMLIKGLKRLEYRGYDSAGIALINSDNCLNVYKSKGKVSDLETFCADKKTEGTVGIAHTRWLHMASLHQRMLIPIILSQRI